MARLLTREELDKQIERLVKLRKQMTADNQRACVVCESLTIVTRRYEQCWCDYDSPGIGGDT